MPITVNNGVSLQEALTNGVLDITIASGFASGATTFVVPTGITVRDYWNIGAGNKLEVQPGANLRWGVGIADNLLVGNASSSANLQLATGAKLVLTGAADNKIESYELMGDATVSQQAANPLLIAADETFTIAVGAKLTVAAASDTLVSLADLKPVVSVHASGAKLVVNGELVLSSGSRIVLGNGVNSITKTGTITNNAGTYDGSTNAGVVGILDASHIVVAVP